jgi:hypothetical protein
MRSTGARIALLLFLIATVGIRVHAVRSRDSAAASFDVGFAIKTLITESGLLLRDNPVRPPSILSWAVYFQRPECSEPSIIVPFALNSEALVLLARIAPKQPYSPTFIYLDETWTVQNRVLMFIEWLKHVAFDLVGANRYLLVWTAIVVAEPTECQPSAHVDWRLVWDKDWNQAHIEKRTSLREEGEIGMRSHVHS